MASPAAQSKAQALNNKLESEARLILDEIEKRHMRIVGRHAFRCAVTCYDKAGTSGPSDVLEHCVQTCQAPHQQANQYVQQEIAQYQNRLNRAMADCQDRARDKMQPGYENDAKKMQRVEDELLFCMSKTVDEYIGMLKPLKERIISQLKK